MATLPLTTALAPYPHTQALTDGTLQSDRIDFEHLTISPITRAFRQMVRTLDYDIAEMAFSTYLCARAHHKPMTGLPIFLLRRFEHGQIVINTKSGIQSPTDLHGRKVGLRSYTFTPGVWTRGILQSAYGVDPNQVTWVLTGDEHVAEYVAPDNVVSAPANSDLTEMLLSGEIDAAIGLRGVDAPDIAPLIPNPQQAGIDHFRQTGLYPISHLVVIKNALLDTHDWLAAELVHLFNAAKDHYLAQPDQTDPALNALKPIIGDDPLRYGVEPNREIMETFIQFNVDQGVIPTSVTVDDLFPDSVLNLA